MRVCAQCGVDISHRRVGAIYCTEKCGTIAYWNEPGNRERKLANQRAARVPKDRTRCCAACAKNFKPANNRQKFCCEACRYSGRKKRTLLTKNSEPVVSKQVVKTCPCGNSFVRKSNRQIHCSNRCPVKLSKISLNSKIAHARYMSAHVRIEVACQTCSKDFVRSRTNQKYCSSECQVSGSQKAVAGRYRPRKYSAETLARRAERARIKRIEANLALKFIRENNLLEGILNADRTISEQHLQ